MYTWLLFLHLHLDLGLQARFGLLHEHLISDSNSSGAKGTPSSTTIGSIEVVPSFSFRPWSVGDKAGGSGAVAFLHTKTLNLKHLLQSTPSRVKLPSCVLFWILNGVSHEKLRSFVKLSPHCSKFGCLMSFCVGSNNTSIK